MNKNRAKRNMLLMGGNSHPGLAQKIANRLQMELCPTETFKYKNGETNVKIGLFKRQVKKGILDNY